MSGAGSSVAGGIAVDMVIHRILSDHKRGEFCDGCPCPHCGTYRSDADGDHTCPCPYSDNDCPDHLVPTADARDRTAGGAA